MKKLLCFLITLYLLSFGFFSLAKSEKLPHINVLKQRLNGTVPSERQLPRLYDEADLFSEETEKKVLSILDENSEEYQFDFAIATTTDSSDYGDIEDYCNDFYDFNGFGYGETHEGVMMTISMNPREVYIDGCGDIGTMVFTYDAAQEIIDTFYDALLDGDYDTCAEAFAEQSRIYLEYGIKYSEYENDEYDFGEIASSEDVPEYFCNMYKSTQFDFVKNIIISVVLGLTISGFVVLILSRKLKTIKKKYDASDYQVDFNLTRKEDRFLYSNVTRTPIPQDNSSNNSGSSGSHTSFSGSSHSGGGRSF